MKPLIRKIDFTLAFFTEYMALLIVSYPILNVQNLFTKHLLPTLLMSVIMFLTHLRLGRIHPSIFIPVTLISILAGWLAGLSIDIALVFGILLLWRTFDVFKGYTFERLWFILAVAFGFSIAYSHGLPPLIEALPHHEAIMPLLIIETLSVFVTQLVFMGFRQKKHKGRLTNSYLILSIFIITILVFIGKALMAFFSRLSRHIGTTTQVQTSKPFKSKTHFVKEKPGHLHDYQIPHWLVDVIAVVGVIAILLLVFAIVKWKWGEGYFKRGTESRMLTGHVEQMSPTSYEAHTRKRRLKAPNDPVRMELYRLEKRLKKTPHGRSQYDTIRNWFSRLPVNDKDKDIIANIYEKVRYGYKKITKKEWEVFQGAIENAKANLKGNE